MQQPKRRRASDGSAIPSSPPSDRERISPPTSPPSDIDSDEDIDDEIEPTQQAERISAEDNQPAEYGILEAVHVENFMCHKNEKWKLSPLINFMCGKNGSGKSAILTAIVVCLGGKAAGTGRGSALKDFIRHGENKAIVTCDLKNKGRNAFRNDLYGDTISVERSFTSSGASGFKIRNASGKPISTKKGDLEEILDHYCLQIDNPLNVLSQDASRSFMAGSRPSQKYQFFLKGVLLEQLDSDYRLVEEQIDSMTPKIRQGEEDLTETKRLWQTADRKLKESRKLDGNRERISALRHMCIWAQVEEEEARRDAALAEVEAGRSKIAEAEQEKDSLSEKVDQAQEVANQKQEHYQAEQAKLDGIKSDKSEAKDKAKEAKEAVALARSECRVVKDDLKNARKAVDDKRTQIRQEEARLAEADGGGAVRRLQELGRLEEAAQEAKSTFDEREKERSDYISKGNTTKTAKEEAEARLAEQQARVNERKAELQEIRKNESSLSCFGPRMPEFMRAIDKETRFRQRPIGPFGLHMKLADQKWAYIIEKVLGKSPSAFVVTNKADSDVLTDLKRRFNVSYPVHILRIRQLDIRSHEPDEHFLTVLRALEFDHPHVRSTVITQHNPESAVLVEDYQEARDLMNNERPHNVKQCFTFLPGDRRKGFRLFYSQNTPAQDPVDEFVGPLRIRSNVDDQIRFIQQHVADEEARLTVCRTELQEAQQALIAAVQAYKDYKVEMGHLLVAQQQAQQAVDDKNAEIDQDTVVGGTLEALKNSLHDLEKEIETKSALYGDAVNADDKAKEAAEAIQRDLAEIEQRLQQAQANVDKAKVEAQKADQALQSIKHESAICSNRILDGKEALGGMQDQLQRAEDGVLDYIRQAGENGSERVPIPEGETFASLDKKWERLTEELAAADARMGGDPAAIERKAADALETYTKAKHELEGMTLLRGTLQSSVHERLRRWRFFRQMIGWRARSQFIYLLSERGFRGKLIMDHTQHQLDLLVEPDITKRDGTGRSARTLSGGEKSFAQICLLLALWEAMGSPLRCLDEFDVFMDAVNRNMSVNLLIQAARQSQGRQYIMISPGTKSDIKAAPDVHAFE